MNRLLFVWISTNDEVEDILFGFVMKRRSFPFGEREGDRGPEQKCVGCNLCKLVCPVDNCITMEVHLVSPEYLNWIEFQKRGLPLNDH